jgi:seryl-tRNA synthetase
MAAPSNDALQDAYRAFRAQLIDAGLLISSGVDGVYGLSQRFEHVVEQFDRYVSKCGADRKPEVIRFPPLLSRDSYQRTDHFETFPQLLGSVHSFNGDEKAHAVLMTRKSQGGDWSSGLEPADVVMTPAVCYPLYPTASGTLPPEGRTVDLRGFVFRHEPSIDPARLQIFRMHEFVRLGTPDQALEHRDYWHRLAHEMLLGLGLKVESVVANDPFFGRGGRVMAATQREQTLKFELVVPVASAEKPTAVASFNYHLDHFSLPFKIKTADGAVAHSACMGFGLERVALALFKTHGFDSARWPAEVRATLDL